MTQTAKKIYILIGPKGSGKTYIGTLLQDQLHIPFLRVEDIALRVKKDRHYTDADYIQDVFQHIETVVRDKLIDGEIDNNKASAESILETFKKIMDSKLRHASDRLYKNKNRSSG